MNIQDLRYVVAVDDHRHFGRAAEACFVSQPTLSSQLRKLEDSLGVELFERAPRKVMPTTVGRLIIHHARGVLVEVDQIEALAKAAREPGTATLRVGVFPTLAPYLLPHVVTPLHRRFPDVELLWVEEKTDEVVEGLLNGRLDAGLLALPVVEAQLHREPLFTEDFVLAVPADHELADAQSVGTDVLVGADVLLLTEGHCLRDQALEVCSLVGAAERHGFRATSLETLRQMVAAGVGVTLLPKLSVSPPVAQSADVRTVAFETPAPSREIAMFWRRTSVHAELLAQLAAVIADLPAELVQT
ncbi:MAG: LysR substrate-binding domain-containing protein [Candidatus Microthrix parvicella]|jgi:LysR family hydrogen peroxide-inducible transcriptional activator